MIMKKTTSRNIPRRKNFSQVCVWPGTIVGAKKVDAFVAFMLEEFNARVQFLEEIKTGPDRTPEGYVVEGTGDRNDAFFAVHDKDLSHFAVPRLQAGIRWLDDAISETNGGNRLYPERVNDYRSWE